MQRKDLDEGGRRRGKGSRKEENEEKFKKKWTGGIKGKTLNLIFIFS